MVRAVKKNNKRRNRIVAAVMSGLVLLAVASWYLLQVDIPVLQPAGPIAAGERHLLIVAFLLMLLIVIPVFVLTFGIAWRYRESNHKATYKPNWDHSRLAETVWWVIPSGLIAVLAVMTWYGTFQYDPYKPIASTKKALTVQVVALDWRWLFIYPEQKVASINYLRMPVNTPVNFQVTADAPMNSFWIPQLGGQVYAMPGMNTRLNLLADRAGNFVGRSANISGKGFASMQFTAVAGTQGEFNDWVKSAQKQKSLSMPTYSKLAAASTDAKVQTFSKPAAGLYETVINKYMFMPNMDHMNVEDI